MSDAAPAGLTSALKVMRNRDFLLSGVYQKQQWQADRKGADHRILEFERHFIRRMEKLGIPMYAHCVVRSMAEQTAVYVQGNSKAKAGQSPHNYGLAVDLVHSLHHWQLDEQCWRLLGHIGKEVALQNGLKLVWGGDWKFYDPAHWEVADWRSIAGR